MKQLVYLFFLLVTVHVAAQTVQQKSLSIEYDFGNRKLLSGEELVLLLPSPYLGKGIDFVSITHKQDPTEEGECGMRGSQYDCFPAYTSVEFFQSDIGWRYWGGSGSGPYNSKFAEVRAGYGETDNLYDWQIKGHIGFDKSKSKEILRPSQLRIRSVGPDSQYIQKLVVRFLPEIPNKTTEFIFSKGFQFGDYITSTERKFPSGAQFGVYRDSFKLTSRAQANSKSLPKDWIVGRGVVEIPLEEGLILSTVEIAVGDMREVPLFGNPDNYRGSALVTVKLLTQNGTEILTEKENVPSLGILRLAVQSKYKLQKGDRVMIEAHRDLMHIMGVRLAFLD